MTLEVGDTAPDFTLKDHENRRFTLSDLRGRKVVLMFYPLAFSPVCTSELANVTEAAEQLRAAGAEVVGVSVDSHWTLRAWREQHGYQARLLADFNPRGEVARRYGVYLDDRGYAARTTFVVDEEGRIATVVETPLHEAPEAGTFVNAVAGCSR